MKHRFTQSFWQCILGATPHLSFLICSIWGGWVSVCSAQSLSGQINEYASVSSLGEQYLVLDDVSAFSTSDKVLILQMKGAIISETDDETYGTISEYGNAGNYEINQVLVISGDTLHLTYPVGNDYVAADIVQAVRIPIYAQATVSGTLTGQAWDGQTGGVIALEVSGKLTLGADINAQEIGFRGGDLNGSAAKGGTTYICAFSSGQGGIKGEGVTEVAQAACRGKLANGGGGGNDHNGGGGGGGNYGSGGIGGHGWKSNNAGNLSDLDKGGRGGANLDSLYELGIPKLFLGGGGGGGHQNNGASVPAANGAGIVLLIADTVEVTSPVQILANALDATDVHVNDGAGGGGAGGAILLAIDTLINPTNLSLDVSGGEGASVYTRDQHGPGGGGAGGYINSRNPLPASVSVDTAAGESGLFISSNVSNIHHNTSHGAVAGTPGAVLENLMVQVSSAPPTLDLDDKTPGTDFQNTFYLIGGPVNIAAVNDVGITDMDDTTLHSAVIEINNPLDGIDETLRISLSDIALAAYGIKAIATQDSHRIVLIGTAPIADYETVIGKIVYQNSAATPNLFTRSISIVVNDGGANSNVTESLIDLLDATLAACVRQLSARWDRHDAVLEWAIEAPLRDIRYEVERSTDGNDFHKIELIRPPRQPLDWRQWHYRDRHARRVHAQMLYYRIRVVHNNGQYLHSRVVKLTHTSGIPESLLTGYHVTLSTLTVRFTSQIPLPASIALHDARGEIIRKIPLRHIQRTGEWNIPLNQIPSGLYIIRLTAAGRHESMKVLIF